MTTAAGSNNVLNEALPLREIGWFERWLGPENYRIVTGLLKTPASILGFILIALFIIIALAAPYIIPPVRANADPYTIPRDGYSSEPRPMMSAWERNAPPLPFWWKPIMHTDHWVHILGTSQGQYDIFYGIVWGTRTAFKTGLIVVIATFLIGRDHRFDLGLLWRGGGQHHHALRGCLSDPALHHGSADSGGHSHACHWAVPLAGRDCPDFLRLDGIFAYYSRGHPFH